jgi:hypothetical protein
MHSFATKLGLFLAAAALTARAGDVAYRITGQGWSEAGRIMHSTDTLLENLNGNPILSAGAQFTAYADIGGNWEGAFGIGGYQTHSMVGSGVIAFRSMQFSFKNFITESRMTYFRGDKADPSLSVTFGNFNYDYNPDIKNLGLYLFRGTVYPGFLQSGFLDPAVDNTKADILGLKLHQTFGKLGYDVIFANEREYPPTFDWSLGSVAKYRPIRGLEFGAGVNLYRILSANSELTTPSSAEFRSKDSILAAGGNAHAYDHYFTDGRIDTLKAADGSVVMDSATGKPMMRYTPTVEYTHRGVKLMAMASYDPKPALGLSEALGPDDLKIYGEASVIGVQNYGSVYNDISQRIPVMFGINLPTFRLLDVVSLEVEWYGARYRNNLSKLDDRKYSGLPSPVPVSYKTYDPINDRGGVDPVTGRLLRDSLDASGNAVLDADGDIIKVPGSTRIGGTALDIENLTADNWKWSLYFQKTVRGHIRFSGQLANDHYIPQPSRTTYANLTGSGMSEFSSSLKDWYFMFRMGYFF